MRYRVLAFLFALAAVALADRLLRDGSPCGVFCAALAGGCLAETCIGPGPARNKEVPL